MTFFCVFWFSFSTFLRDTPEIIKSRRKASRRNEYVARDMCRYAARHEILTS